MANTVRNSLAILRERGARELCWQVFGKVYRSLAPNYGNMAVRDPFADIRKFASTRSPVIVDGGANEGNVTATLLRAFERPTIHAFEPNPDVVMTLTERYQSTSEVHVHEQALGPEPRTVPFHVTTDPVSSSVRSPTETKREYRDEAATIERTIEIEQVRLDEVLSSPPDVLKLDLQGYELDALRGATEFLDDIPLVFMEVEFLRAYEEQALFADVDDFMRERGFQLFNLYELKTLQDGQLGWGDALYLNRNHASIRSDHHTDSI